MTSPSALLLLPGKFDHFILSELAADLCRTPGVEVVEYSGIPLGAYGRLPQVVADRVAKQAASRIQLPQNLKLLVIFHPLQLPLAKALLKRQPSAKLWYSRWDRYEAAQDASRLLKWRLRKLHLAASSRADLTFAVSRELVKQQQQLGYQAELVPLTADSFPQQPADPESQVTAVSLGHLGRRTDWKLLDQLAQRLPQLTLLMIGTRHDSECQEDPYFKACCERPNIVFVGHQNSEQAAQLIRLADVGIIPFKIDPFNSAGLPYRILKYARLGIATVSPPLAGAQTWERAVEFAKTVNDWEQALLKQRGRRLNPDLQLRSWALSQTAANNNRPLHQALNRLGFNSPSEDSADTAESSSSPPPR